MDIQEIAKQKHLSRKGQKNDENNDFYDLYRAVHRFDGVALWRGYALGNFAYGSWYYICILFQPSACRVRWLVPAIHRHFIHIVSAPVMYCNHKKACCFHCENPSYTLYGSVCTFLAYFSYIYLDWTCHYSTSFSGMYTMVDKSEAGWEALRMYHGSKNRDAEKHHPYSRCIRFLFLSSQISLHSISHQNCHDVTGK